jgi:hypothetical protein
MGFFSGFIARQYFDNLIAWTGQMAGSRKPVCSLIYTRPPSTSYALGLPLGAAKYPHQSIWRHTEDSGVACSQIRALLINGIARLITVRGAATFCPNYKKEGVAAFDSSSLVETDPLKNICF